MSARYSGIGLIFFLILMKFSIFDKKIKNKIKKNTISLKELFAHCLTRATFKVEKAGFSCAS